jgi:hypothetical protein
VKTSRKHGVIAGLDPAIHLAKAWMPGSSPGMTIEASVTTIESKVNRKK